MATPTLVATLGSSGTSLTATTPNFSGHVAAGDMLLGFLVFPHSNFVSGVGGMTGFNSTLKAWAANTLGSTTNGPQVSVFWNPSATGSETTFSLNLNVSSAWRWIVFVVRGADSTTFPFVDAVETQNTSASSTASVALTCENSQSASGLVLQMVATESASAGVRSWSAAPSTGGVTQALAFAGGSVIVDGWAGSGSMAAGAVVDPAAFSGTLNAACFTVNVVFVLRDPAAICMLQPISSNPGPQGTIFNATKATNTAGNVSAGEDWIHGSNFSADFTGMILLCGLVIPSSTGAVTLATTTNGLTGAILQDTTNAQAARVIIGWLPCDTSPSAQMAVSWTFPSSSAQCYFALPIIAPDGLTMATDVSAKNNGSSTGPTATIPAMAGTSPHEFVVEVIGYNGVARTLSAITSGYQEQTNHGQAKATSGGGASTNYGMAVLFGFPSSAASAAIGATLSSTAPWGAGVQSAATVATVPPYLPKQLTGMPNSVRRSAVFATRVKLAWEKRSRGGILVPDLVTV